MAILKNRGYIYSSKHKCHSYFMSHHIYIWVYIMCFFKGELIHLCVDLFNILELGPAAGFFILSTCMTHLTVYF